MSSELEKVAQVYGDVCIRKQRRKRQKLLIIELFLDYAKNSTLHGLRYITERGLTAVEKLFWIITFIISASLCAYLINNVYIKWKTSPVIVSVSERLVSVSEVPFPSVTICPQIKSRATVYDLDKELQKLKANKTTDDELEMLADISFLCDISNNQLRKKINRNFTNANFISHITQVAPNVSFLFSCKYLSRNLDCSKWFKKVYTCEGVCYNFNSLAAKDLFHDTVQTEYNYTERTQRIRGWSTENDYLKTENYPFPLRGNENGATPDLEVILLSHPEESDGLCNSLRSGYKIFLQNPTDLPQSTMYYYAALNNQVSSLAVSYHVLKTSETLKNYYPDVRQCYFPKDRQLRYFKIYTADNCRAECLSNITYLNCDCVGYYMPHHNGSQICAENQSSCMKVVRALMAAHEQRILREGIKGGCRCLPACNTIEYDAEILKTDYNLDSTLRKRASLNNKRISNSTMQFSKIEIYFKKSQFVSMRRSEIFGITDFMANIGGLLGLFLGFSFLSLVELFYFLTLRVGFTLKRDLKEEKKSTTKY